MITYVLSNILKAWHVHRYADDVTVIATCITTETEAEEIAINLAKNDRPSQVLKISQHGDHHNLGTFGVEY